jgi:uncharacterized membrane protein
VTDSPPPDRGVPTGGDSPQARTALSYGFREYFANWRPVLAVVAVALAAQLVFDFVEVLSSSEVETLVFSVLGLVVGAIASLGIYQTALMITAGVTPTLGTAFSFDRWTAWVGFSIVFGLLVGVGLTLCVIPGLIALAYFGMAPYFFIDQGLRPGQAFSASRRAATSRGFALPVLVSIVVGALGLLGCGVGFLVTAPAGFLAVAFLYRNAAGQPVAS